MRARIFALFLVLVMAFGLAIPKAAFAAESDDVGTEEVSADDIGTEEVSAESYNAQEDGQDGGYEEEDQGQGVLDALTGDDDFGSDNYDSDYNGSNDSSGSNANNNDPYFDEYGYDEYYAYVTASCADNYIKVGESTAAQAYITTNAMSASLGVRWNSSDPGVASVTGDGNYAYVHGRRPGTANITATLYMEGVQVDTDSFSVRVNQAEPQYVSVSGISVDNTSVNLPVGVSHYVHAEVHPGNADNKRLSWSSNNSYVASVNQDGEIRANNTGQATITVRTRENGYQAYINVNVYTSASNARVENVWVNPTTVTLAINQYMYITPSVYPANAADTSVTWASNNPGICTVSDNGKITGVAPGTAVITCRTRDGGKTATTTVNVQNVVAGQKGTTTNPVVGNTSRSSEMCFKVTNAILTAAPGSTVTCPAVQPMAFDTNVALAMKMRPDVTVAATFPFQGHNFVLTLPAGYDLSKHLDVQGYAEWLFLCALKDGVTVTMVN